MTHQQESDDSKLTLDELRKIWNDKDGIYSDEDLEVIGDWVAMITDVIIETCAKERKQTLIIDLKPQTDTTRPSQGGRRRRAS